MMRGSLMCPAGVPPLIPCLSPAPPASQRTNLSLESCLPIQSHCLQMSGMDPHRMQSRTATCFRTTASQRFCRGHQKVCTRRFRKWIPEAYFRIVYIIIFCKKWLILKSYCVTKLGGTFYLVYTTAATVCHLQASLKKTKQNNQLDNFGE